MLTVTERATKASRAGVKARRAKLARRLETGEKRCPVCRRTLPLSAFGLAPSRRDGHHGHCKACRAQQVREQRAAQRAQAAATRFKLLDGPVLNWWVPVHRPGCVRLAAVPVAGEGGGAEAAAAGRPPPVGDPARGHA
jgi:hypothetical protein